MKENVFDEQLEKEIKNIRLYEINNSYERVVPMLEKRYEETKYPGFLAVLGEIYCYGYCRMDNSDEEKGFEYLNQAVNENYSLAKYTLSDIYLGKAGQYIYKAGLLFDEENSYDQMMSGCCLMADYLLRNPGSHYYHYDQYYEGLEKIVKAYHSGDDGARFILDLLNNKVMKEDNDKVIDQSLDDDFLMDLIDDEE